MTGGEENDREIDGTDEVLEPMTGILEMTSDILTLMRDMLEITSDFHESPITSIPRCLEVSPDVLELSISSGLC